MNHTGQTANSEKELILIIEDDIFLAEGLRLNLEIAGYTAECVHTAGDACGRLGIAARGADEGNKTPDLILLDVNLPDGDGFSLAENIKEMLSYTPILFLTARDMDEDMLRGFRAGADDYITKPFNVQVLTERIRAVLKRCAIRTHSTGVTQEKTDNDQRIYRTGNLEIDFASYEVKKNGQRLTLTPTEFRLLEKFCRNEGCVLTRNVLLEELWDNEGNYVDEHTLTLFVSRLRRKIADEQYSYIKNVYGTGYRWM